MSKKNINVLELNNIDIIGKRFNGYSLQEYINNHPETSCSAKLLVNTKLGDNKNVVKLFTNSNFETYDCRIEEIEQKLNIKNQISVTEEALKQHPLFKESDILHFHMYHNMHLPIEFLTRIPPDKQIILDIHDTFWFTDDKIPMLEVFKYADTMQKKSLDAQRKRVLKTIDAQLVVHSPFMAKLAKQSSAVKNLRITNINFGIDNSVFRPLESANLRKKYHIQKDDLVLLCRAQREFKGIDYVIEALKILNIEQHITVVTVGCIGYLNELKSKYKIIDLGTISNETIMNEVFNLCDIFLAPSTEESFGFMAVEAMSCAKPVIVFNGTALPDTVHAPTIGISTNRSAQDLAEAIKKLANNPKDRVRRGQAAREYVIKNYNEEQYFKNYVALFKKLSKKKRNIKSNDEKTVPTNLRQFKKALKKGTTTEIFDYDNFYIQKQLFKYNHGLYHQILRKSAPTIFHKVTNKIKHLMPQSIKKIIIKVIK